MANTPTAQQPWAMQGGVTSYVRVEGQRFARQLLQSQQYQDWLVERIKLKTLDPSIERMLWAYGFGKPPETINVNVAQGQVDMTDMSLADLQKLVQDLGAKLDEAKAVEDALPAEVVKGPW